MLKKNEVSLEVDEKTLEARKKNWKSPKEESQGVLRKYAKMVGSASSGAVTT